MNDYDKALSLAKSGDLKAAQQILLGLSDERSERLLQKVNAAMAARGSSATVAQSKVTSREVADGIQLEKVESFQKGCVVVLVIMALMFLCIMLISFQGSL